MRELGKAGKIVIGCVVYVCLGFVVQAAGRGTPDLFVRHTVQDNARKLHLLIQP